MFEIVIPKLNNNDTEYVIVEWLAEDGEHVEADTPVAVIETSKVAHDLVAPRSGTLRRLLPPPSDCAPGDVAGQLFDTESEYAAVQAASGPPPEARVPVARAPEPRASSPRAADEPAPDGLVITEAAREQARRAGIPAARLRELGLRVVRASDVERLTLSGQIVDLSPNQRMVARTVSSSEVAATAAHAVLKVRADAAFALRRRWIAATGEAGFGIPALLVKAVAEAFQRFPVFFGTLLPGGRSLELPAAPHVGVTIDVGTGLFVPVVRDPAARPLGETAAALADFRARARAGTFDEADLGGGTITVTLHDYTDVVSAIPVVFPGQVAALSLGGTASEPFVGADGQVGVRKVFHLGLAYDHRVVNGRDAVMFLKDVKAALESPDRLLAPSEDL